VAGTRDLSEEHFSKDTEIMPILQNVIYVPYSRRPKKFEPRTTSVDSDATLSVRLAQCLRYFHVSFESPKCSSLTGVAGMWQACHWLPGTWPTATSRETLCQLTLNDVNQIFDSNRTRLSNCGYCTFATSILCVFQVFLLFPLFPLKLPHFPGFGNPRTWSNKCPNH
jgi:hypothetical protein